MDFVYKLFKYEFSYGCQGTMDKGIEYALLHVPEDASFSNNRSTLYQEKHQEYYHEIDYDTIQDLTIQF